ncbi:MAG: hypothetical protein ABR905_00640 [Terracidiphilus sp.]|jgi:hypothetical protein
MDEERKGFYHDLKRDLNGFPAEEFVRAYFKAYLEADVETIRKLQELLLGDISERGEPDSPPDPPIGSPIKPRPHLNSGAIALPEPDKPKLE